MNITWKQRARVVVTVLLAHGLLRWAFTAPKRGSHHPRAVGVTVAPCARSGNHRMPPPGALRGVASVLVLARIRPGSTPHEQAPVDGRQRTGASPRHASVALSRPLAQDSPPRFERTGS